MDRKTVEIYEQQSERYEAQRTPRHRPHAERFGRQVTGGLAADLGCGPGWYTDALGSPAVALDAALAMLRRTREVAPGCLPVQADLLALPIRRGGLGGAWARNTYVHLRAVDVPLALADLHRSLLVGAPIELTLFGGDVEGREVFPGDDLPGRWFSTWPRERLEDVVAGAGFALDELEVTTSDDGTGYTVRAQAPPRPPRRTGRARRSACTGRHPGATSRVLRSMASAASRATAPVPSSVTATKIVIDPPRCLRPPRYGVYLREHAGTRSVCSVRYRPQSS